MPFKLSIKTLWCLFLRRFIQYMGMFSDNMRHGSGLLITNDGTYCETTFSNGEIGVSWSVMCDVCTVYSAIHWRWLKKLQGCDLCIRWRALSSWTRAYAVWSTTVVSFVSDSHTNVCMCVRMYLMKWFVGCSAWCHPHALTRSAATSAWPEWSWLCHLSCQPLSLQQLSTWAHGTQHIITYN